MQDQSDAQLLRAYAQGSDAAFREIVTRHADLVYASALRQARSPELARDIAQTVFSDLVRKAPALAQSLPATASLVGWLYRSTRFEAHTQMRDERRRQARERQAMQEFDPTPETASAWERVGPVLDEAMADLNDEDRDALLLRFFKNHDFRTIGAALGVSDDTAQKRVSRALDRLRAEFNRRGVTTSAVALTAALSANAVAAGPAGLAATLSTAALTSSTLAATATATATKAIAMTTLQKTIIGATLAVAVGTGIYEAREASNARTEVETLRQQHAPLAEQVQQLSQALAEATNQIGALRTDNERLNRNSSELLKLRGEAALFRNLGQDRAVSAGLSRQQDYSGSALRAWKRDQLVNAGRQSSLDAVQTFLWAHATTNLSELAKCIVPSEFDPPSEEAIQNYVASSAFGLGPGDTADLRLLSQTNLKSDEVRVELQVRGNGGSPRTMVQLDFSLILRNVHGEWKIVVFTRRDTDGKASGVHLHLDPEAQ